MGALILAWAIGEGIIVWRALYSEKQLPVPGNMLAATALFAGLAVLAEYEPARKAAIAFSLVMWCKWYYNLAANDAANLGPRVFDIAAGNREATYRANSRDPNNLGATEFVADPAGTVRAVPLDRIVDGPVHFIKIEGVTVGCR